MNILKRYVFTLTILLGLIIVCISTYAVPLKFKMKMRVDDEKHTYSNTIVTRNIMVKMYRAGTQSVLWSEEHEVRIVKGQLTVFVGSKTPINPELLQEDVDFSLTVDTNEVFWSFNTSAVYTLKSQVAEKALTALSVDWDNIENRPTNIGRSALNTPLFNIISKSSNYTAVAANDSAILCNTTSPWTLTLPSASVYKNKVFTLKKTTADFNLLSIKVVNKGGGLKESGQSSTTTSNLATEGESITVMSDGKDWHILERKIPAITWSYTPNLYDTLDKKDGFTNNKVTGKYYRKGDRCFVEIYTRFTGVPTSVSGTKDAGHYFTWTLPTQLQVDASKMANQGMSDTGYVGTAQAHDSQQQYNYPIGSSRMTANGTRVFAVCGSPDIPGDKMHPNYPFAFNNSGTGDWIMLKCEYPVSAWKP